MKVKDLIKDDIQSLDWWIYDQVMSGIDYSSDEYSQVMALPEVLRNTYIAHTFLDELNSGGLDYYYDSSAGKFAKELFLIFSKFSFESAKNTAPNFDHEKLNHLEVELLEALRIADETVAKIEARLGFEINDNIEHIKNASAGNAGAFLYAD